MRAALVQVGHPGWPSKRTQRSRGRDRIAADRNAGPGRARSAGRRLRTAAARGSGIRHGPAVSSARRVRNEGRVNSASSLWSCAEATAHAAGLVLRQLQVVRGVADHHRALASTPSSRISSAAASPGWAWSASRRRARGENISACSASWDEGFVRPTRACRGHRPSGAGFCRPCSISSCPQTATSCSTPGSDAGSAQAQVPIARSGPGQAARECSASRSPGRSPRIGVGLGLGRLRPRSAER